MARHRTVNVLNSSSSRRATIFRRKGIVSFTVDPAMTLRMLTYTALSYQRLDADGVLRDCRALPPVLPVVLSQRPPAVDGAGRGGGLRGGGEGPAGAVPAVAAILSSGLGVCGGRGPAGGLLCRLAARKFDAGAAEGLAAALAGVTDPDRLARVGEWIIECATASELLARVRGDDGSGG